MRKLLILTAVLAVLALPAIVGAAAGANRYLVTLGRCSSGGDVTSCAVQVNEDAALRASSPGSSLIVPDPRGGWVRLDYARQETYPDGNWTWIGTVAGSLGPKKAVITFGKDSVFGYIPRIDASHLTIASRGGRAMLLQSNVTRQTAGSGSRAIEPASHSIANTFSMQSDTVTAAGMPVKAAISANPTTVDVLVVTTTDYRELFATAADMTTRIDYLVAFLNQALSDSGVTMQFRIVHVKDADFRSHDYPSPYLGDDDDFYALTQALDTGVPAALGDVLPLRKKYGADNVVLFRSRTNQADACSSTTVALAHHVPLNLNEVMDAVTAYAEDASCNGSAFAEAMGLLVGLNDTTYNYTNLVYPYGNPYSGVSSDSTQFSTLMGHDGEILPYFSNPNITKCFNMPCGVADQSDAARVLNITLPALATFMPTRDPAMQLPPTDINGDDRTDLLFLNSALHEFSYRVMDGASVVRSNIISPVGAGYFVAGQGDFNGDGRVDLVWTSPANDLYMWVADGRGDPGHGFVSTRVGTYPAGWKLVGVADVDGDGKADLLFHNASTRQFSYRIMSGTTQVRAALINGVGAGYTVAAVGDFNGDGKADIVWTSAANDLYMWTGNGTTFTSQKFGTYPAGWKVAGAVDVDGDGRSDLLFYNANTRQVSYRIMNGTVQVRAALLGPAGSGYWIAAIGDYNGDGKADIVWTSAANDLYMWTGNGTTFVSQKFGTYPSGWQVVN